MSSNNYTSINQHIYRHTYDPCDNNQNILNTMNPTTIYTHANNNNNNGILNNMLSFQCDNNNFCNDYGVNNMNTMNYTINNCQRTCHSHTHNPDSNNNNHHNNNAFNSTTSPISPTASTHSAAVNHNRYIYTYNTYI